VVLAGTGTVVVGPAGLDLKEGTTNVVYAWGSAEDHTLALPGQAFGGMDSTPLAVHPGAGGTAATPNASDRWRARAATPARSR
ncbi:hypothetical protein ACN6LI_003529, partial [Streptomyces violaceoruber]